MLMMEPRACASMPGRNALIVRCIDFTLRSKLKSQSRSEVSSTVPWWTKPAALKSTSTGPSRFAIASMALVSRASSATHSATPASLRSAMAASLRSLATTRAPARANASAVARPMPAPEAVQKANLPLSRSVMLRATFCEKPDRPSRYGAPAPLATITAAPGSDQRSPPGAWRGGGRPCRRLTGGSPADGRFEARGLGLALGAEPALATGLLNAAAVVVGRPGQHVDAAFTGDETFDRAAVRRAALGLVPDLGAELGRPLYVARSPDAEPGLARLALQASISCKEPRGRERVALAHQFAVDIEPAARAGGERSTGAVDPAHGAGKRAAVDELAQGRVRGCAAAGAPGGGAAGLLQLGGFDAGEPHSGSGDAHEVPADGLGAPQQRLAATDHWQLAGKAGKMRRAAAPHPGEHADHGGHANADERGPARDAKRVRVRQTDAAQPQQEGQGGDDEDHADRKGYAGLAVQSGAARAANPQCQRYGADDRGRAADLGPCEAFHQGPEQDR